MGQSLSQKEKFARFLLTTDKTRVTASLIIKWATDNNSSVQAKSVNSDDDVVIKFSASEGWIRPYEWLANYQNACLQRYYTERDRLKSILTDQQFAETCSKIITKEVPVEVIKEVKVPEIKYIEKEVPIKEAQPITSDVATQFMLKTAQACESYSNNKERTWQDLWPILVEIGVDLDMLAGTHLGRNWYKPLKK